jgi:Zn-dependent M28 family amino/carboxypeptidase
MMAGAAAHPRTDGRLVPGFASLALLLAGGLSVASAVPTSLPLAAFDPAAIGAMTGLVSTDSLNSRVANLESFDTRRSDTDGGRRAAEWIEARFQSFGADSVFAHTWSRINTPNVVAVLRGRTRPHEIVLVGGHYDSISRDGNSAPGADDNASGTACVLECARVMSRFRFETSVHFVAFSAEEFGLLGSNAYAAHLVNTGDELVGAVNVDMIGYLAPGDQRDLDIISDVNSVALRDAAMRAGAEFVPELPLVDGHYPGSASSDQISFWMRGLPAISLFEDSDGSSPYLHTANDLFGLSYNDPTLATLSTRVAVALLASLAGPIEVPVAVEDLTGRWGSDGVEITWRLSAREIEAVRIERGLEPDGPWEVRTPRPLAAAPRMRFVDEASPDQDVLWYRLQLLSWDGGLAPVGPLAVRRNDTETGLMVRATGRGDPVEIRWELGSVDDFRLDVYDARGRHVRGLATGPAGHGTHLLLWDKRDDEGAAVTRGVYLVHLNAGAARVTRKLVLLHD